MKIMNTWNVNFDGVLNIPFFCCRVNEDLEKEKEMVLHQNVSVLSFPSKDHFYCDITNALCIAVNCVTEVGDRLALLFM